MIWVVLAVGAGGELRAQAPTATERLARLFSREVREAELRLAQLAGELEGLPALLHGPQGSRYGFHSGTIFDQAEPQWVQLDLGRSYPIDGLVAMPAHVPTIETQGEGYGFPRRFKIEVADNAEMRDAAVMVNRTAQDVENPGLYPLVFRPAVRSGRYVRFTSTKHDPSAEGFFWAMEELLVLAGNRNVAAGCLATASSHLDLFPNWAVQRIVDSQSAMGVPVTVEPSPTDGYLSAPSDQPVTGKWLVVDLGQDFEIDEIRLIGVESEDHEVVGGRGFPRDLMVELAVRPGFESKVWQMRNAPNFLGHPWGSPVVMPCAGRTGRYIRVMTKELWARDKLHSFALAELQAYAGGVNVALGKPVRVMDAANQPGATRWAPQFVVDGYTSRHRLIELPEYLELIVRRGSLVKEQKMLEARRDRQVRQVATTLGVGGGGLGGVALLGWAWMLVRQKAVRRRDVVRLREQIARDLHDDIGSNLGGIVLLSEMGSRHSGLDEELRNDFKAIKQAAEETSESMQDIVWLIQPGNMGLRELVLKMRQSVAMMLGNLPVSVVVEPPEFRNRQLSLLFRRHLFFAFKETLNNVRRHAAAVRVEVRIAISPTHLAFTVRDDGAGFDPQAVAESGHGLRNLQRRAERLKGTYRLASTPGHGTSAFFKAPLKS
ncbi:MAG: histidine kinase [Verrucomicrobia bacterium]|nr:histidine kinase [Verrucomicrobiota bacterium]